MAVGDGGDQAEFGVRVQRVRQYTEALSLLSLIVNGIRPRCRRTECGVTLAVKQASEPRKRSAAARIVHAGLQHLALSGENRGAASGIFATIFCLNVHNAARRIAVARWKNTGQKIEPRDEERIDHRQEWRVGIDVQRDQNAVNLILELGAFRIADVDLLVLVDR